MRVGGRVSPCGDKLPMDCVRELAGSSLGWCGDCWITAPDHRWQWHPCGHVHKGSQILLF